MKKIILLGALLLSPSYSLVAEEIQNSVIITEDNDQLRVDENKKELSLYPKNHKTFFLSIDNQSKLLNKLLESKGKLEVIRYFLSLKNHDSMKALEVLAKNGNENLRLLILENLPIEVFAELLNTLFEVIGGQAIPHWGYKQEDELNEKLHMIPNVRAQQYVNFFMKYNTLSGKEVPADGLLRQYTQTKTIWENNEKILKARGQKMAEVFNQMEDSKVLEILYGRPDTRFVGDKDRIVKGAGSFIMKINDTRYAYEAFEKLYHGKEEWTAKNEDSYKKHTNPSRVFSKSINYIIPHLKTTLIVSIFEIETKGDTDALMALIKSLGCEKAFNELFEYLEDAIKDKVYETCSADDKSLFDMLGLDQSGNDILAIGPGENQGEPKEKKKDL